MTPKEKAKELIEMFIFFASNEGTTEDGFIYSDEMQMFNAKQCALVAVDEIVESRNDDRSFNDALSSISSEYYTPHPMYLTYWLQVKQEIENL
jgi:hypothetical protein